MQFTAVEAIMDDAMDLELNSGSTSSMRADLQSILHIIQAQQGPQDRMVQTLNDICSEVKTLKDCLSCSPLRDDFLLGKEEEVRTCKQRGVDVTEHKVVKVLRDTYTFILSPLFDTRTQTKTEISRLTSHREVQLERLAKDASLERDELVAKLTQAQDEIEAERLKSLKWEQKVAELNQLLVRAGRKDDTLSDSNIQTGFMKLRSDIQTLVRAYLTEVPWQLRDKISKMGKNASSDMQDLHVRAIVAEALYGRFFHPSVRLFGIDDCKKTFRMAELLLEESGSSEDDLTRWRTLAVETALKTGKYKNSQFLEAEAKDIWKSLRVYRPTPVGRKPDNAFEVFFSICQHAYELALRFRSSKIEYEWQPVRKGIAIDNTEILGTVGVSPDEEHEVHMVVFGGVYRGDRTTGKLRDNVTQILKPSVTITYRRRSG